jgi:hypothetical protein
MLSREDILRANDLERELVSVPQWGGEVYVRVMTGAERDRYERSLLALDGDRAPVQQFRAHLLALCLCDEYGGRLFDIQEISMLNDKSWVVMDRLYEVAQRLNKTTADAVETLLGNSETTLHDASGSDSP